MTTARAGADRWEAFIDYLVARRRRPEVMAALRRGAGKRPGTAHEMYPYVVPWLPDREDAPWDEVRYYLVATLFAVHQQSSPTCPHAPGAGSVGRAMWTLRGRQGVSPEAVERRFLSVVSADADTLPDRLRQTVTHLRGQSISMDYVGLGRDLQGWGRPARPVQRRWARDFFARQSDNSAQENR